MSKFLKIGFLITVLFLFFYSFTQVDLSLTLSQNSFFFLFQHFFQQIGFFNRPLSAIFLSVIILLLFSFYFIILHNAAKKKIKGNDLWFLIIASAIILTFSYNAFSYDLFNYLFDAKIFTNYGQNPFIHKPLDFPTDPWLNFMRWTHRVYPYGPVWLGLTIPLSYIGSNILLITLVLYKILSSLAFLGSSFFVYKISKKIFPDYANFNLVLFALNPLVLVESLVSSHNDMTMIFFSLLFFYLFIINKKALSFLSYILSVGVKYATIVLVPVVIFLYYLRLKGSKINWEKIFLYSLILSFVAVVLATLRTNFQPWYILYLLPFSAFLSKKIYIFVPTIIATFFGLLIYVPYVLLTDYDKLYPQVISKIELVGLIVVILSFLFTLKPFVKKAS